MALLLALVVGAGGACAGTGGDALAGRRGGTASRYSGADVREFRAKELPRLLNEFGSSDPAGWQVTLAKLQDDERVPDFLLARLNPDHPRLKAKSYPITDHGSPVSKENRAFYVRWSIIYEQLRLLQSEQRRDWTRARKVLQGLGGDAIDAAIANLILRFATGKMDVQFQQSISTTKRRRIDGSYAIEANQIPEFARSDSGASLRLSGDRALWAVEELVAIGAPAVPWLLQFTYVHRFGTTDTQGVDPQAEARFQWLLWHTLVRIGEPAIPWLLLDLANADRHAYPVRYPRVCKLISALGEVYAPEKYINPNWLKEQWTKYAGAGSAGDNGENTRYHWYQLERPDWQQAPKYRQHVLAALDSIVDDGFGWIVSDNQQYVVTSYVRRSIEQIGVPEGAPVLVKLWDLWRKRTGEEDVCREIETGLRGLTGRRLRGFDAWKSYADTVADPSDTDWRAVFPARGSGD